ncbi:hypothetical protein SARC_08711 [Sphaeroforma arctica JP610]|uniref:Uncharacterized protein n=1 Tax=Sphaeroforma arctica JP610 TaxID=667725 RepID=A0A0L0FSB6_9EUKA|nr:hypothetical protein SARC_08711 [Sphaeroforma arctica JP610]KNC78873.1 hypothetical protein SARC_08711 [Sphaeroforma arctica JP610]|eukprot:XP_014152775.1 hypothetical protein SARC_08711 [Sphaeroforma arctica JP610]
MHLYKIFLMLSASLCVNASRVGSPIAPPVWASQVHAELIQNRSGNLAMVELYYDYVWKRNLNIIDKGDTVLYDNERQNGTTYYYHPKDVKANTTCKAIDMRVGILKPTFLAGADYHGLLQVYSHALNTEVQAEYWSKSGGGQAPFLHYYHDPNRNVPVKWTFFDNATFDVVSWDTSVDCMTRLEVEEAFLIPSYCTDLTPTLASLNPNTKNGTHSDIAASHIGGGCPYTRTANNSKSDSPASTGNRFHSKTIIAPANNSESDPRVTALFFAVLLLPLVGVAQLFKLSRWSVEANINSAATNTERVLNRGARNFS